MREQLVKEKEVFPTQKKGKKIKRQKNKGAISPLVKVKALFPTHKKKGKKIRNSDQF